MKKHTGKWQGIMIHHTAAPQNYTLEQIRKIHTDKGWGDIGYHYVIIIKNGRGYLKTGRSDVYQGAHCDTGDYNNTFIGVAVSGNYSEKAVSAALYEDILGSIAHLCKKYGVKKILGHRDVKATECPGLRFPLAKLKEDIKCVL